MMSKRSNFLFEALNVIAWVIFIGLCIEAGALIFNFAFSLFKPEAVHNLYQKLDLSAMYNRSKWAFYTMGSFILAISIVKAYLFYALIQLISKLDLAKPFNNVVSKRITYISYYTFAIGLLGLLAYQTTLYLHHHDFEVDQLNQFWTDSQAFILMSAVVYVLAAIFTKGVELQSENELTI